MTSIFLDTASAAQLSMDITSSHLPDLPRITVQRRAEIDLNGTTNVLVAIRMLQDALDALPEDSRATARLEIDYEGDQYDSGGCTVTCIWYDVPETDQEYRARRAQVFNLNQKIKLKHDREVEKAIELLRSIGIEVGTPI